MFYGVHKRDGTLNIGAGMRPDLMGTWLAPHFLSSFLDWAGTRFSSEYFSVTVSSFNQEATRLFQKQALYLRKSL